MTDLQRHFEACAKRLLDSGEKLYPLGKAATFIAAARGEKTSPASLSRWILRGKQGVRLDAVRLNGGGWWTSREALSRFAAALSARIAEMTIREEDEPTEHEMRQRARAAMERMGI